MSEPDDDRGPENDDRRRTASLAALAFVLALIILGLWLSQRLRHQSTVEDCLMSGRTNCAPIETGAPSR